MARRSWFLVAAAAGVLGCSSGRSSGDAAGGGRVRWTAQLGTPDFHAMPSPDGGRSGAGADAAGNRIALVATLRVSPDAPRNGLELRRLDASGRPLAARSWTYGGAALDDAADFRMAAAPDGDVLVGVAPSCFGGGCPEALDLGAGPIRGPALVRLDPGGAPRWQRELAGSPEALAVDASGGVTVLESFAGGTALERLDAGGEALWSLADDADACTADEDGNAVCASHGWEPGPVLHVRKRAAGDARVLWTRDVAGPAYVASLAARAGEVAVIATRPSAGELRFGGTAVRNAARVLLVLDGDGTPRWAAGVDLDAASVAIAASGRVFAAGDVEGCARIDVQAFAPRGGVLWRAALPAGEPCAPRTERFLRFAGLAAGMGGEVAVLGFFLGTLDVGGAALRADAVDAFLAGVGD